MTSFRLRILAQVLPFLLIAPGLAVAQTPPTRGEAAAALHQINPAEPAAARYTRQQIDQLAAPIALYPDELLAQVLMAATYPQQIVEAAEWLKNPRDTDLKGDALVAALQPLPWDPSVKALVAFPQIVAMMTDHIEWTEALGVAFATQQAEVMARVQVLRHLAYKSGRLRKLRHLAVREEGPVIVIGPAEPDRIFVPVYNPVVVFDDWPDRDFQPVFIPPPPDFVVETIEPGLEFSAGLAVVGPLWGWGHPDWRADRITVDRVGFTRLSRNAELPANNVWSHAGPVVLVTSTARPGAAAATVPAGTVAPAAAAAVTSLPQRAAAQPALIQTQTTPAQPSTAKPGQAQTTPAKPSEVKPGQVQTTIAPPGTAKPGEAQTTITPPSTAKPGQAQTTTAPPGTAKPGQAQTTTTQPGEPKPGQAQTTTGQPSEAKPSRAQSSTRPPTGIEGTTSEPGRPEAKTAHPAESASPPHARTEPGQATTQPGRTMAPPGRPSERLPGQSEAAPSERHEMPRTPNTPSATGPREPGSAMRPAERTLQLQPERQGAAPPSEAREPAPRAPEHAGTRPPQPAPGPAAQRPAAPEGIGHGSSTPPPAAAKPPVAQPAQPPHEPGGGHQPGRSEEGGPKER